MFFCKCKPEPPDLPAKDCDISEFTIPHDFNSSEYKEGFNILIDIDGNTILPRGKPFQNGDKMITVSDEITDHNMKAFVKVFSIMAPVRDTLIFHLESTSKDEWKAMTDVLTKKGIKTEQFLDVSTPKENYYSSEGIFLHLNEQEDCHSMMKYLEEAELELKCLLFDSSFDFTNPEGDNYCPQPKAGVGFVE